jgi:hypothetical protein
MKLRPAVVVDPGPEPELAPPEAEPAKLRAILASRWGGGARPHLVREAAPALLATE